MYNEKSVKKKVNKILKSHSYGDKKIHDQSLLTSDLQIDSLGYISILADIESEFKIEIDEEELVYLSDSEKEMTASDMAELIMKRGD